MKTKLFFAMLIATAMAMAQGQTNWPGDKCLYQGGGGPQGAKALTATSTGTKNMIIILCVEQGQSTAIADDPDLNMLKSEISGYINRATFSNWHINVLDVLVHDNDGTNAHAFVLPGDHIENQSPPVPAAWVNNVLDQADAIYDFANYDTDHNGYVDYVAFIC